MPGRAKLTASQVAEIVDLVEAGAKPITLAGRFGVSANAIDSRIRNAGVVRHGGKFHRNPPIAPASYTRGGKTVRLFTRAEDDQLRELEAQGLKPSEIARRLGRNTNTITARLVTLALHEEASEVGS